MRCQPAFCSASICVVLVDYLCGSVSVQYLATLQGIMFVASHVGASSGHIAGGFLIELYGAAFTFSVTAVGPGCCLVALFLTQQFTRKEQLSPQYEKMPGK
ncbi:hypothetical protein ScPMuIL_012896 [Solemya velum]